MDPRDRLVAATAAVLIGTVAAGTAAHADNTTVSYDTLRRYLPA